MALTIIADPGLATSNCYCSLEEAETYMAANLYTTDWDNATEPSKNKSLVMATRLLDEHIDWKGTKSFDTQALRWPREGITDQDGIEVDSTTIPQFLKNATTELSKHLLKGDRTAENELEQFESVKVGPISLKVNLAEEVIVLPESVLSMILQYGSLNYESGIVKLERT